MSGLETGDGNLQLTEAISQLLETKAGIKMKALGWPHQIQEYADREAIDWWVGFKTLTEEIMEDKDGCG